MTEKTNDNLRHDKDVERDALSEIANAFLASEPQLPPVPDRKPLPRVARTASIKGLPEIKETAKAARSARRRITTVTTGDNWTGFARLTCNQRQLFGPLWYEGEICILFADTNVGKSLLAVQIADTISKGADPHGALPQLLPQTEAQPVLYADFEMSMAQFARRYSSEGSGEDERGYYGFSPRFNRLELNYMGLSDETDDLASKNFADLVLADIEAQVDETGIHVLIVDNITFLASGTETAADAQPLMKKLVALKKKYDLSILVLAHTPKRSPSNPLTGNDIQGSKSLINFTDSAFAIGKSVKGKEIRYIKQIKQRNIETVYGDDNVLECRIGRVTDDFIGFRATGCGRESDHLADRQPRMGRQSEAADAAREMRNQGKSADRIAEELGVNRATVYRWLKG